MRSRKRIESLEKDNLALWKGLNETRAYLIALNNLFLTYLKSPSPELRYVPNTYGRGNYGRVRRPDFDSTAPIPIPGAMVTDRLSSFEPGRGNYEGRHNGVDLVC